MRHICKYCGKRFNARASRMFCSRRCSSCYRSENERDTLFHRKPIKLRKNEEA